MEFKLFLGNEKIKNQIYTLIESNRLPHAIVIEGKEGLGKRTFAKEIATALVCRSEKKPCYECSQCKKCQQSIHPDVFEYSAEGGPQSFHVDVVRKVKSDVYMQPNEAERKVYILGNCQCMSISAQNAILKILEEPPQYALFILTVDSKSSLLETVLSRSMVITVNEVDNTVGAKYICNKLEDVDYNLAFQTISSFNGNIGKTIESINDGKVGKSVEMASNICYALMKDNEFDLLCAVSDFDKNRQLMLSTFEMIKSVLRDALVCSNSTVSLSSGQEELVKRLSKKYSKSKLLNLISAVDEITNNVLINANNALIITKVCYMFRRAIGR